MNKTKTIWDDDKIKKELIEVINISRKFPTRKYLLSINKKNLSYAIHSHGGINKFKHLLGYVVVEKKHLFYWTHDNIIKELTIIINDSGHFPSCVDLPKIGRGNLLGAINKHGGITKFRKLMGYELNYKPKGYWTNERIIGELKIITKELCYFPTTNKLREINKCGLVAAINKHGGINKFKKILGYELQKPDGYWTENSTTKELKDIVDVDKHFPTYETLRSLNRGDLIGAILKYGGINKFKQLLGYPISISEIYVSELARYSSKRGKNSEKIVKKILMDYCSLHDIPSPSCNVKLSMGNVIEFVCDTGKRIGIDVTNTKYGKGCIEEKWLKKDYYKHLDELWIVVFSNVIKNSDYTKFNLLSPSNVKVMSIHQFLEELDYSIDQHTKSKIDKYCVCMFHTKNQLIGTQKINNKHHKMCSNIMVI